MKCIVGLLILTVVHLTQQKFVGLPSLPPIGGGLALPPELRSSAHACTRSDKDILVVIEAPTTNRFESFIFIRKFFTSLHLDTRDCYRMSFVVADESIVVAKKMNSPMTYQRRIRTYNDQLNNNKPKENVLKIIENIEKGEYFIGSKETSEKIILMVLPGGANPKYSIADKMLSILEVRSNVIGENGIPDLKFAVLAAGIGKWNRGDLNRITLYPKRTVTANDWSGLVDQSEKYGPYGRIKTLLKNPNDAGFSIGALQVSSEQLNPFDGNAEIVDSSEKCNFALDVAFLVDSSHSIRMDWDKELYFVQRIANRLVIKEGQTHAGVILFSDLGEYTKVSINMTDYKTTEKFNLAVADLQYIGYRTRIDYAFDKLNNELFTPSGGVRTPSIGRLVILITDGKQNPLQYKGEVYDPVKSSKPTIESGAHIVAIGIGNDVNIEQLNNITRNPSHVSLVGSVDELVSDEFVKNISKKICTVPGNLATTMRPTTKTTPCPDQTPKKCSGVGSCSNCCGSSDVYINIIQSSGNYLVQGMRAYSDNGKIAGGSVGSVGPELNTDTPKTTDEIVDMIQKLLPQREDLSDKLRAVLDGNVIEAVRSQPSAARKRRSLDFSDGRSAEEKILDIARFAGCRLFLKDLKQDLILDNLMKMAREGKKYTIFCPTDNAYKKMNHNPDARFSDREILFNHIVAMEKNDQDSLSFNTQAEGSTVRLSLKGLIKDKTSWKVQDSNILLSLVNKGNFKIMLIDQVLYLNTNSIHQTLKGLSEASIFYELTKRISLKDTFSKGDIEKICFKSSLCVTLHDNMKQKLNDEFLMPSGFTVLAPTNREMLKMGEAKLEKLRTNKEELIKWLQEHVFIGQINQDATEHEELLISMGRIHSVLSRVKGMQTKSRGLVMNVMDHLLETKKTMPFRDGFVHVVESL